MRREPLDEFWYILLVNRKRPGDHRLLAAPAQESYIDGRGRLGYRDKPRTTRHLLKALRFETEAEAQRRLSLSVLPRGHMATVERIARYPAPRKPKSRKVRTAYGVISKVKEDQLLLVDGEDC
jgi:hypothetical protein